MPLVFVDAYFDINVDLKQEVVWATHPVAFTIEIQAHLRDIGQPFGVIFHLEDDDGVESDKAECGGSEGLMDGETWTSEELTVTPTHEGGHAIEIGLYRDGQLVGSGRHRFDALVP